MRLCVCGIAKCQHSHDVALVLLLYDSQLRLCITTRWNFLLTLLCLRNLIFLFSKEKGLLFVKRRISKDVF